MDVILSANQTNTSYKRNRRVYIRGHVCWINHSACAWDYDQRDASECCSVLFSFWRMEVLGAEDVAYGGTHIPLVAIHFMLRSRLTCRRAREILCTCSLPAYNLFSNPILPRYLLTTSFQTFKHTLFFNLLLPPIILNSGYELKQVCLPNVFIQNDH